MRSDVASVDEAHLPKCPREPVRVSMQVLRRTVPMLRKLVGLQTGELCLDDRNADFEFSVALNPVGGQSGVVFYGDALAPIRDNAVWLITNGFAQDAIVRRRSAREIGWREVEYLGIRAAKPYRS